MNSDEDLKFQLSLSLAEQLKIWKISLYNHQLIVNLVWVSAALCVVNLNSRLKRLKLYSRNSKKKRNVRSKTIFLISNDGYQSTGIYRDFKNYKKIGRKQRYREVRFRVWNHVTVGQSTAHRKSAVPHSSQDEKISSSKIESKFKSISIQRTAQSSHS